MNRMEDVEVLLDRAATQIRSSEPDPKQAKEAAARVWAHLTSESAAASAGAAEIDEIRGCDDYQALIPAYLAGSLPAARKLLLEDHSRECVPCRRALKEAREGKPVAPARSRKSAKLFTFPKPVQRFALAAALVAGLGAALYFLSGLVLYGGPVATVQTVDGQLFRVTETAHLPVLAGDEVRRGELLRTGRDGGAVLRLKDGSMVEVRERSELAVREGHRGTTIALGRGNVIVQAAPQGSRRLFVATDDCEVAVKGTIFSVNHGMKGSRVSVIEGEVRVVHDGQETALLPGEQIATHPYLGQIPVEREIEWSRDVDAYIELLKEYRSLRREIDQRVPPKSLRHDTRLLDLMPEDTVFFAALPNLSETVAETHRVIREQIATNPVLQEWWNEKRQYANSIEPMIDDVVDRIARFGEYLGEELAIGAQSGAGGEGFAGPLVLAQVVDQAGFRDFVESELDRHGVPSGEVAFLDDPFAAAPEAEIYLWLHDDLVVGSPHLERIRQVAGFALGNADNPFLGTDFHQRVAELYGEGVEILVAADLEGVVAAALENADGHDSEMFARLGVLEAQHLMLEQKNVGKVQHRAVLTFNDTRRGLASWLAEPAPMGALDFVSAEAKLVGAVVLKDPAAMMKDLASFARSGDSDRAIDMEEVTSEFKNRLGLDLDDFIEVLGGELAFAVDGPLLPVPSWKLILEVYDPARFQFTVEQAIAEVNQHLLENGKEPIEITEEVVGGRTYYSFPVEMVTVYYTYVEGYLIAAPSRALIDRAIRYRESGYTITESSRFRSLLPVDGQNNFSAIVFQDLTSLVGEAAQQLGQGLLTPEQQQEIEDLTADSKPTLGYAYAEDRRIIAAAQSDNDVVSTLVQRMLGLENPMGFASVLSELPFGL